MERVDVDGLTIAYERAGDGPPLVLLHGGSVTIARGGGSSSRSRTGGPWWPRTRLAAAPPRILGRGSPSATTRTALPGSSGPSGSSNLMWAGCRSARVSHSSSTTGSPSCRGR
jgi:hypothetical protein